MVDSERVGPSPVVETCSNPHSPPKLQAESPGASTRLGRVDEASHDSIAPSGVEVGVVGQQPELAASAPPPKKAASSLVAFYGARKAAPVRAADALAPPIADAGPEPAPTPQHQPASPRAEAGQPSDDALMAAPALSPVAAAVEAAPASAGAAPPALVRLPSADPSTLSTAELDERVVRKEFDFQVAMPNHR